MRLLPDGVGAGARKARIPPRHLFMHRKMASDCIVVMSGEIDMLLNEAQVHLKAGDVPVQQSTNRSSVNRGTEICRLCVILVDAEEQ